MTAQRNLVGHPKHIGSAVANLTGFTHAFQWCWTWFNHVSARPATFPLVAAVAKGHVNSQEVHRVQSATERAV